MSVVYTATGYQAEGHVVVHGPCYHQRLHGCPWSTPLPEAMLRCCWGPGRHERPCWYPWVRLPLGTMLVSVACTATRGQMDVHVSPETMWRSVACADGGQVDVHGLYCHQILCGSP